MRHFTRKLRTKILRGGSGKPNTSLDLNTTLQKISTLLYEKKIYNWFIAYGTLLGIVRDNSCINSDDDVDIIIDKKYKIVIESLPGIKVLYKNNNFLRIILDTSKSPIDFYFSTVDANGNFFDNHENVKWLNVYPFEIRKWNNVILQLPQNYKEKLTKRYGNWKIPIPGKKGIRKPTESNRPELQIL
jgi:hypothetical protein